MHVRRIYPKEAVRVWASSTNSVLRGLTGAILAFCLWIIATFIIAYYVAYDCNIKFTEITLERAKEAIQNAE